MRYFPPRRSKNEEIRGMGLRIMQLLGGLIPSSTLADKVRDTRERMVVGEYPLGVDGKSDGV